MQCRTLFSFPLFYFEQKMTRNKILLFMAFLLFSKVQCKNCEFVTVWAKLMRIHTFHHSIVRSSSSSTIHKCYYNLSLGHLSNRPILLHACALLCYVMFDLAQILTKRCDRFDGAGVCFGRFDGVQGLGVRF